MNLRPDLLRDEARDEAYGYFDKNIRNLPKDSQGNIDPTALGLEDNAIDAFRHAYVSGVFTMEYNEKAADMFGRLNELSPLSWYLNKKEPDSLNMDLWNNSIGRKYGKRTKSKSELLKLIHAALNNEELITDLKDKRKYKGSKGNTINQSKPVVVLVEDDKGRNQLFFDLFKQESLTREEFVTLIKENEYPGYFIKIINGIETPVSKPDSHNSNNLE